MKRLFIILFFLSGVIVSNGQVNVQNIPETKKKQPSKVGVSVNSQPEIRLKEKDEKEKSEKDKKTIAVPTQIKNFGFGVDVFYNLLPVKPLDINSNSVKDGVNRGTNVYGLYRIKVKYEPMRVYVGLGISCQNFYFKAAYGNVVNSNNQNVATLIPIDKDNIKYRYSKLSMNYLYIPLGVYFKTNSGFNVSFGVEGGLNIDNHSKYIGDDIYVENGVIKKVANGTSVNIKRKDIKHVNTWRFNGTFRIGYKWINAFCSYQINSTFKDNLGPKMNPVSLGITIQPF